jgi:hypothetical protein
VSAFLYFVGAFQDPTKYKKKPKPKADIGVGSLVASPYLQRKLGACQPPSSTKKTPT